ncbi:MAG: ABC transporter ATP-binding protein [Ruminococcus sp.]|uniref:ABC transporter ATP-binding protein n=1 Tax=Ruminococcus sp. TaxID=41978 RepID=UPI0025E98565|nr:ABC transporter ATP-binding protein [Ruminococcus sp.]MBR0528760.1 ABC transporter ATP-binding protein [Ruminococcus sp.]
MIEINNVTMKFDKNKGEKEDFTALDGVSINIPESCIYGFLGSNGAGKSTLMRLMCGVYPCTDGSIKIDGREVFDDPEAKGKIFFVNDETIQYSTYTLKDLKNYYKCYYPQFSEEVFDRLTEKLSLPQNKRMSQFSKGMKRQAVVVAALSCKTKYIMLDEAFDGLDPAMRKIIKTMIVDELMDRDAAMIVSSHNVAEINELCDRAMLIHQGHLIFAGEVDEIKSGFCKLQTSLGSRQMTKEMAEAAGLEVMQFSTLGSVAQMIVRGGAEDCLAKLKGLSPILLEAVPLTLEEIFIYELEVRGYGADILKEN